MNIHFWSKNTKVSLLVFLLFLVGLWFLQDWAIRDNLKYGFRGDDWWILLHFETFGSSPLMHLINTWKTHAVYSYQIYYAGFLVRLLGIDFYSLYQASHVFKYLSALSIFPLVYLVSKNKLMAVISTIIYVVSYPSIGALYMFVTGGYYIAIIVMSMFLIIYYLGIIKNKGLKWFFLVSAIFILTLFLNAERMYPLIPLLILIEIFLIWRNNWTKKAIFISLGRLFVIFLPLISSFVIYIIYFILLKNSMNSQFFVQAFAGGIGIRFNSLEHGNWQLLTYPFASFGSLFLMDNYWKVFGMLDLTSFSNFVFYLITKPLLILFLLTLIIMFLISKMPLRWTAFIIGAEAAFYLTAYWMYKNWLYIDNSVRIHFDPYSVLTPAAFGFYILILSLTNFFIWLKKKEVGNLLLVSSMGALIAFFFIFLTWLGSDIQLLFMGPQRYLTTPAIGSSVFMAGIITFLFSKFRKFTKVYHLAPAILLIIIPIIIINMKISKAFFDYELHDVGMDGAEQTMMKNEFWSIVPNMSNNERSLFYFDETADKENGYFDESTVIAGLESWALFDHGKKIIKERPEPGILRTNIQCPEISHESCIQFMRSSLTKVNGEEGILYADWVRYPDKPRFYKLENLYALRFINKHLVNIKEEVLKDLLIEK